MQSRNPSNGAFGADEAAMAATQPVNAGAKPYLAPVVTRLDIEGTALGGGFLPDAGNTQLVSGGGAS